MKYFKNNLFILLLLAIFTGCATTSSLNLPTDSNGRVEYQGVVEADKTQEEIHSAAREWAARNFKSAQNVIQLDDKEAGNLIAKGNLGRYTVSLAGYYTVNFTLQVESKDGRFRYTLDQFTGTHTAGVEDPLSQIKLNENEGKRLKSDINNLIESLTKSIKGDNTEEW